MVIVEPQRKGVVGKKSSDRYALKATYGLSRFNETGNTQPEMPRAGPKWSPREGGGLWPSEGRRTKRNLTPARIRAPLNKLENSIPHQVSWEWKHVIICVTGTNRCLGGAKLDIFSSGRTLPTYLPSKLDPPTWCTDITAACFAFSHISVLCCGFVLSLLVVRDCPPSVAAGWKSING